MLLLWSLKKMVYQMILLCLFLCFAWQSRVSFSASQNHLCHVDEALALLNFKQAFAINASSNASVACENQGQTSFPRTASWNQDTDDCCRWDGVSCDELTGFVLGLDLSCSQLQGIFPLNSSLFNLSRLEMLNLAYNDFGGSGIPHQVGSLAKLRHLNLSSASFSGIVPSEMSRLSSLISLDLSSPSSTGQKMEFQGDSFTVLLQNLTSLEVLFLDYVSISKELPKNLSSSLIQLSLYQTGLHGELPGNVFRDLQKLTLLNLGNNSFTGQIPLSMTNLNQLEFLSLSQNSISGPIPTRVSGLQKLDTVNLENNLINGTIPSWLLSHPLLSKLLLSNNQLRGQVEGFDSKTLEHIDFSNNQLHGPIPQSISALENLKYLDLSWNNFHGSLEMAMFSNLSRLQDIDLSYNNLSLIMGNNAQVNFPFIESFSMSSCEVKEFPEFLKTSENLRWLDLSDNQIQGEIPDWFSTVWPKSLKYLNLSHNSLTGLGLPSWNQELWFLDLQSNLLQGPLPSSICNLRELYILNLSGNKLSGTIPPCLGNFSSHLSVLNLRGNSFSGTIPEVAKNNSLKNIGLTGNKLEGPLPRSLTYSTHLEVFDVANNSIKDTFPWWLEVLPELQVMMLRSNKFHGSIGMSRAKTPFPKLRILEISSNNFSGTLPEKLFENFKAMMNTSSRKAKVTYMSVGGMDLDLLYQDSLDVVFKGLEAKLYGVSTTCIIINLSHNEFEGVIPESIGNLHSLLVLNMSHNQISGHIPSALRNLNKVETLDLSWNQLEGQVPSELTSLTFLQVFNVSQNHLVGRIPRGNQFETFQNDSYGGNLALCGYPLSVECPKINKTSSDSETEEDGGFINGFTWEAVLIGYVFGMLLGLFVGSLVILTGKPIRFIRFVEGELIMKIKKPLAIMKKI